MRDLTDLIEQRGNPGMTVKMTALRLLSMRSVASCGEIYVEWQYISPRPLRNGKVERLASPPVG